MKKILTIVLFLLTLNANAFWGNNNNSYNNYGYQQDNGIFSFNPYDYWDPRWYSEEMSNMIDEFSDNNNYNGYGYNPYNNYNGRGYGYNPYNNYNSYNNPYNQKPSVKIK